jgi:glucosamine-6-phosphate deaminase
VALDGATIESNARYFANDLSKVPTHAITMGIATILEAKQILLMASGEGKAEIIRTVLKGEITTRVPGSVLQKHNNVRVLLDKAAAALL